MLAVLVMMVLFYGLFGIIKKRVLVDACVVDTPLKLKGKTNFEFTNDEKE